MDHTSRNDAAGADVGDGSASAAQRIVVKACEPSGAVDLIDRRHRVPETWHFSAAEWAEFLAAVKAGRYDSAGT
jgi:hypothetical protein